MSESDYRYDTPILLYRTALPRNNDGITPYVGVMPSNAVLNKYANKSIFFSNESNN